MTYLVAFDGSALSRTALRRAAEFAEHENEQVVAVAVIPGDFEYARDRGWTEGNRREFDPEDVAETLREEAASVAPDAEFRAEHVSEYAGAHTISHRLQKVTTRISPDLLFIGSENAGRIVTPISSVGTQVASDDRYDVYLVRHPDEQDRDE